MRTVPVDLILHSLLDLLRGVPADTPDSITKAIALCINPCQVAEEWNTGGNNDMGATPGSEHVSTDTRWIEVAVARRLADVAFSLTIEQTAEASAKAATLLRAAQAIVGLVAVNRTEATSALGFVVPLATYGEQARERANENKREFKVGDKVIIARKDEDAWIDKMDCTLGVQGTVLHYDPADETCRVEVPGDWWWYSTSSLDLVTT